MAAVPVAALGYLGRKMPTSDRHADAGVRRRIGLQRGRYRRPHPARPGFAKVNSCNRRLLAIVVNGAVAATLFAMSLQRGGSRQLCRLGSCSPPP